MANKILIVCPIGIGNFLMLTPAIQRLFLNNSYDLDIFCLKYPIVEMAESSQWFSNVYFWDPDQHGKWMGIKTLKKIRQTHYQAILRFFPTYHWKYSFFSFFLNKKNEYGFVFKEKKVSSYKLLYKFGMHDVDQNHRLIDFFLNERNQKWYPLKFFQTSKLNVKHKVVFPTSSYFVCHIGCSSARGMIQKRLPIEKWVKIIENLYQKYKLICVPIGGPDEKEMMQSLLHQSKHGRVVLMPTKSLSDLNDIVESSLFFMGNDSGLMHLCVALQKRVIAFFGPSDENRVHPYYLNEAEWLVQTIHEHLVLRNQSVKLNYKKINLKLPYNNSGGLSEVSIEWALTQIHDFLQLKFPDLKC